MAWWKSIPLREPYPAEVDRLSFDLENPRYTSDKGLPHSNDREIIQFLYQTSDLSELLQSIASSGYIDIEPMIVLGKGKDLIVLEGNRRLAALKLLRDPTLAAVCGIAPPPVEPEKAKSLQKLRVYRVANRRDARDFIGFKHINGAHAWDSLAKARFAAQWLRDEVKDRGKDASLQDIAHRMGDRHATLARMVHGVFVLEQAEKQRLFSIEDREPGRQFAFSHLYTALTRPGVRDFIGLGEEARSAEPKENPVPKSHRKQLQQLMRWLYGSKSEEIPAVVQSQNPHVKQLSEVLSHPKARKILLESAKLERAYAEVDIPLLQFENRLVATHGAIENAVQKVSAYDGEDATLLEIAIEIHNHAELILDQMRKKSNSKK